MAVGLREGSALSSRQGGSGLFFAEIPELAAGEASKGQEVSTEDD